MEWRVVRHGVAWNGVWCDTVLVRVTGRRATWLLSLLRHPCPRGLHAQQPHQGGLREGRSLKSGQTGGFL